MRILGYLFAAAAVILLLVLLIAYLCFRKAFYVPRRRQHPSDAVDIPEGEIYEEFRDTMEHWVRQTRALPYEKMSITSFDDLKLFGKFYEYAPGAPIELMFHGYRGNAERELSGGVERCFRLGRSALIVDQRCCGESEGSVITFGIREYRDCLRWLAFMRQRFGPDVKMILTGISMGAATVLMAAGTELPENVIGVLADCGYCTPKDIICSVIRQMGIPDWLGYPFVKLGAKLYGRFDLEEYTPVEALKKCTVPVIFFHGDTDDYVPWEMSRINYEACAARKELVLIPGAGHGLCFPVAPERYLTALRSFFGEEASSRSEPNGYVPWTCVDRK